MKVSSIYLDVRHISQAIAETAGASYPRLSLPIPCVVLVLVLPIILFLSPGCGNDSMLLGSNRSAGAITVDLGRVSPGDVVKQEALIRNTSSEQWNVVGVQSSCRCAAASIIPSSIEPGDDAVVVVEYHAPIEEKDDLRTIMFSIKELSDPLTLTVKATVRKPIHVNPDSVKFQGFVGEHKKHRTFLRIENSTGRSWRELAVSKEDAPLADVITILPSHKPTSYNEQFERFIIPLEIDPRKLPAGLHRTSIAFASQSHRLVVPMVVELKPPIVLEPESLFLGELHPGEKNPFF